MSMNLMLAIYYEHKARTNHDVFNDDRLKLSAACMYIDAEKRELDKQEETDYKNEISSV